MSLNFSLKAIYVLQMCSHCGEIKRDLKLSDREWRCSECNQLHDRDIYAANNIRDFGIEKIIRLGQPKFKPVERKIHASTCVQVLVNHAFMKQEAT